MSKLLVAMLLAAPTHAAYLDYSATFLDFVEVDLVDEQIRITHDYSEQLPRFNPALGRLRSVVLSLDLQYEWFWTIRPLGPEEISTSNCAFTWLSGSVGPLSNYINVPEFADCGYRQPDGSISGAVLPRESFYMDFYADIPGSNIWYFIGTTPFEAWFRFTGTVPAVTGGSYASNANVRIDSSATVLYVYDEVPEPSVIWPLALALTAMGAARRLMG